MINEYRKIFIPHCAAGPYLWYAGPGGAAGHPVQRTVGVRLSLYQTGYRLFEDQSGDTPTILCFAGVRFMLGSVLVFFSSLILQGRIPALPKSKKLTLECCALGLWQTTTQYTFYYIAVAMLTGAFGGILNSTQSFLGVILAHFVYGKADRMTPAKALGCAVGFAGVLVATIGNHGGGSGWGVFYAGRYGHLYLGRAVEQVGHQKGGQLYGMLPESGRGRLCPAADRSGSGRAAVPTGPAAVGVLSILWLSSAAQGMCCGPC